MDKKEFLEVLRQTLSGEVSNTIIEQNVRYYDQYISSQASSEKDVIITLGDPRLIAKTIIETDKIAKQKVHSTGYYTSGSDYYEQENESKQSEDNNRTATNFQLFHLQWYHKVALILILILFIIFIVVVGRIIIGFLFAFAVPILLLLLLYSMFRKRS